MCNGFCVAQSKVMHFLIEQGMLCTLRSKNGIIFNLHSHATCSILLPHLPLTLSNPWFLVTIIMIAHRLSTLSRCDRVVQIDGGRIARVGSFAEIVGGDPAAVGAAA